LNSDDVWEPTKLEKQVNYLDANTEVGVVFTRVTFIDETGNILGPGDYPYYSVFDVENKARTAWLRHFFVTGNCLCHPSSLVRRNCHDKLGLYNKRLFNLHDFDMWVRLCFKYEIHILDDKLFRFRIRDNEANAGSDTLPNRIRFRFEHYKILDHYLGIDDKQLLLSIFPEAVKYGPVENEYIPYFLGMLALKYNDVPRCLWGLEVLFNLIKNAEMERELEKRYGFSYRDFIELTERYDAFHTAAAFPSNPALSPAALPPTPEYESKLMRFARKVDRFLVDCVIKIDNKIR